MIWHKDADLPQGIDLIAIPGGFSFGDYLRCGAIAANSPVMASVVRFARQGGHVLGVCNGFQVLIEADLLPGALMRNARIKFSCKSSALSVETANSVFSRLYEKGEKISLPIAHHDGNYFVDDNTLAQLEDADRIALRYIDNPNGSTSSIAGVLSENHRILGMMPHPERAVDPALGKPDGQRLFAGLAQVLAGGSLQDS